MKTSDIKRLEKVVKKYKEIEELLSRTYDSTDNHGDKFTLKGICPTTVSVYSLIRDMLVSAVEDREYIEGKIKAFIDAEKEE